MRGIVVVEGAVRFGRPGQCRRHQQVVVEEEPADRAGHPVLCVDRGQDVQSRAAPRLSQGLARDGFQPGGPRWPGCPQDRRAGGDHGERRRLDDVLGVEGRGRFDDGVPDPFEQLTRRDRDVDDPGVHRRARPRRGHQRDPQAAGVHAQLVGVGPGRRRRGVLVADRRRAHRVEQGRQVPHRPAESELDDLSEPRLANQWAARGAAPARYQPTDMLLAFLDQL